MEYVYAALLLHKAGKEITEDAIKKVLEAAGVNVDEAKVKALVAALEGVNIDEVIEKASFVSMQPVQASSASSEQGGEEKKEEKKEEESEEKKEEEISAGLSALFG